MDEDTAKTPLERIIDLCRRHDVEFILIGGQAEVLYGSPRVTYDVDICPRRTVENLERLAVVLRSLQPVLRNAPPDLPFRIDAQSLALATNLTLRTSVGDLDVIGHVEPLGGYEELTTRAEVFAIGDAEVRVIALDDLIRVKEYLGRPKDRQSLVQLLAIKRVRGEEQ